GSLVLMAKTIVSRTEKILRQCEAALVTVERITAKSMENRWPYLKVPQLSGGPEGLFEDRMAGYLNPRRLVSIQASLFERAGGVLFRGAVNRLKKDKFSGLWQLNVV